MPTSILLDATSLEQKVSVFKALADRHRLEIIAILEREVRCHCHLQELLDLAPNLLSYHLKVLREAGLIVGERRGRWIDYAIAPSARDLVEAALPSFEVGSGPSAGVEC